MFAKQGRPLSPEPRSPSASPPAQEHKKGHSRCRDVLVHEARAVKSARGRAENKRKAEDGDVSNVDWDKVSFVVKR